MAKSKTRKPRSNAAAYKKMAMERMKFNILKPAIKSTYEDATANDLINMYNSLFV